MALVCRFCIAIKGLKGSDLKERSFNNDDELFNHIEGEHHLPIKRDGETEEKAMDRFHKTYPEAGGPNCKCPACVISKVAVKAITSKYN